jgi:hypothetical protein
MTGLRDLIRKHYDDGDRDLDTVARQVLAEALASGSPEDLLYDAVRAQVGGTYRSYVRALEHRVTSLVPEGPKRVTEANSLTAPPGEVILLNAATAARQKLLNDRVNVPGEGLILWGKLTVEQHQKIIDRYASQMGGMARTARLHEEAIKHIRSTPNARCLDDCQ